jgi:hypothetical protein
MPAQINPNSPDRKGGLGKLDRDLEVIGANATVQTRDGDVFITKRAVAQIVLPAPTPGPITSGGDDSKMVRFSSTTAYAHVITCPTVGFNAKGSSGSATMGAAIGSQISFLAYQGNWYTTSAINTALT